MAHPRHAGTAGRPPESAIPPRDAARSPSALARRGRPRFGSVLLQLAVIEHAVAVFVDEVVTPTLDMGPGLARLDGLIDSWVSYIQRAVFPGGCFVQHCLVEQIHRPGPVREALTEAAGRWVALLASEVWHGIDRGELAAGDPDQIAFELEALLAAGNRGAALGDPTSLDRAAKACRRRCGLDHAATAATSTTGPPTTGPGAPLPTARSVPLDRAPCRTARAVP